MSSLRPKEVVLGGGGYSSVDSYAPFFLSYCGPGFESLANNPRFLRFAVKLFYGVKWTKTEAEFIPIKTKEVFLQNAVLYLMPSNVRTNDHLRRNKVLCHKTSFESTTHFTTSNWNVNNSSFDIERHSTTAETINDRQVSWFESIALTNSVTRCLDYLFNIWPFRWSIQKSCKHSELCKSRLHLCQILKEALKKLPKTLKMSQSGKILPILVTLKVDLHIEPTILTAVAWEPISSFFIFLKKN